MADKKKNAQVVDKESIVGKNLSFAATEAYKLLRTNLLFSIPESKTGCKTIGITSALASEGKSITSVNLAYTFAETGKKVLIIDCDMRKPTVHKILKIKSTPGLSNLLVGLSSVSETVVQTAIHKNLYVLPVGNIPPNPSELIGSKMMEQVISGLSQSFDFIVLDLPPVNVVSDGLVAAKLTDGIVFVVRQNYCFNAALSEAVRQLEFLNIKVLGFVMTRGAGEAKRKYGSYKYGRYKYGKYGKYGKYAKYGDYALDAKAADITGKVSIKTDD